MPPYKKTKTQTRTQKGKKSFNSKSKSETEKNSGKKTTIGPRLVFDILDSRKIKIDGVEISKIAYENLQEYVNSKGGIPIEQVIATLVEQHYNPKFSKK